MLRKFFLFAAVALLPAAVSQAAFEEGDWDLTLGGAAYNGPDFDGTSINLNAQLGYFISQPLEVGIRQSIDFQDFFGGDLNGATRIFADYHFTLGDKGQWVPYVGAQIGYVYGDNVHDSWMAGPEAGVKYFVNNTTYVYVSVEYQYFFDNPSSADNDGQFVYGLGLGVRL